MSFNAQGLHCLGIGGVIADATAVGGVVTQRRYAYITNDDEAAIETDGYFDAAAKYFNPGKTDTIEILADRDGTPVGLKYIVNRSGGDVALITFKGMG
jgi:hypothetical protein